MNRKQPGMTQRAVIDVLRRAGFEIVRTQSTHAYLRRAGSRLVCVPYKSGGSTIPKGTLKRICRQAGLTTEQFEALRTDARKGQS